MNTYKVCMILVLSIIAIILLPNTKQSVKAVEGIQTIHGDLLIKGQLIVEGAITVTNLADRNSPSITILTGESGALLLISADREKQKGKGITIAVSSNDELEPVIVIKDRDGDTKEIRTED